MGFLGCRIDRDRVTLNRRSQVRFRKKLVALEMLFDRGRITEDELQQRSTAVVAFARAAGVDSWQFRQQVLQELAVSGHEARTG